jgi:hypothetical protein
MALGFNGKTILHQSEEKSWTTLIYIMKKSHIVSSQRSHVYQKGEGHSSSTKSSLLIISDISKGMLSKSYKFIIVLTPSTVNFGCIFTHFKKQF